MPSIAKTALAAFVLTMTVQATKYKNIVYYKEWSIYHNFTIFDLDWSRITHVNYAFAKPNADSSVSIVDGWAAMQRWPEQVDTSSNQRNNVNGSFGHGYKLKKQYRGTKFGLSIGGWTLSDQFSNIASTDAGRRKFAKSAVDLMLDLGLDSIDLDWEYPVEGGNDQPPVPHRPDDMMNFVALLQAFRDEFKRVPFKAELSAASPAGPGYYRHWNFQAVCTLLDHINIMTYDLAGSWSAYTDHQANLFEDPNHPPGHKFSVHNTVQDYIKGGCQSDKIIIGIPLYGRSFENSNGLYSNFTKPTKGSWVDGLGIWDYKDLPRPGTTEIYDDKVGATYSYDTSAKLFTSYESPKSLIQKLDYIKKYNLGGTMFWSGDSDAPAGSARSLITQVANYFGKDNMAFNDNNLNYSTSQYNNIRNGLSTGPPTPATTSSASKAPSTPITTTAAPSPSNQPPKPAPNVSPPPNPAVKPKSTNHPIHRPRMADLAGICKGHTNTCYLPASHKSLPFDEAVCGHLSLAIWCP